MATVTVSAKGQVTIPPAIRAALGLDAGSQIEFVEIGKGRYAIVAAKTPVLALKGILRKPPRPVSIEDMNKAIAEQGAKAR